MLQNDAVPTGQGRWVRSMAPLNGRVHGVKWSMS